MIFVSGWSKQNNQLSILSIPHFVINIVTYLKTNDANLNEIVIRFQDKKPRMWILKKWVENILACHGMEPNIQRNADGRRRIGRRMCITDATGAPKQRSGVAYVVVAWLKGRRWSHWARVQGAVRSWYERRTGAEVVVETQLGSQRSRARAPCERSTVPIAVTQRNVFLISGDHTAIWYIP